MSSKEMCNVCGEYTEHIDGECIQCKQRDSVKMGLRQFMQEMSHCNKEIKLIEDEKSIRQYIDNTSGTLKYCYGIMTAIILLGLFLQYMFMLQRILVLWMLDYFQHQYH